jgi:hypothetical protein
MRNNSIGGSQFNFGMDPNFWLDTSPNGPTSIDESCLANDIDTSNTLDGKPMIYWTNQHDTQVPANAGFVMLINCTNITVQGLNLENNLENIVIFASNNTLISDNSLANSVYALKASSIGLFANSTTENIQCFNLTVSDNTVVNSGVALEILQAENSTIQGNTLTGDPLGILSDTNYGTISGNTINNSTVPPPGQRVSGINDLYVFNYPTSPAFNFAFEWTRELMQLEVGGIWVGGNYNTIYGNTVTNSTYSIVIGDLIRGIKGTDNTIFHNNFITSSTPPMQALDTGSGNQWDDGYPAGGNYWSDSNKTDIYSGSGQNITGSDGICDNPYPIRAYYPIQYEYDRYPLTVPVSVFQAAVVNDTFYQVDVQSNSTVSDFTFNESTQPSVSFTVNSPSGTTGYCRVTIPKQLLWTTGNQWTVLVNGTQTQYNISEDAGFTYISFSYSHSTENIQIIGTNAIPEYAPITILPVLITCALTTALLTTKTKRKRKQDHP